MKRIDVVKKNDQWRAESGGRALPGTSAPRKADAVKKAVAKANSSREPVSLKIRKQDGKIQEERTYPRGADPKRRKG